jgi:membrane protease YdiL (CAAX protease family)
VRIFFNEIVRAAIQIVLLSAIPFLIWIFAARKKQSFVSWIGLRKVAVAEPARFIAGIVAALVVAAAMSPVLDPLLPDGIQLANARFAGQGLAALPGAVVFSFFATALPEEILFRGLLGGRLGKRIGFAPANIIQAIVFGLLHGAALFDTYGFWLPLTVIAFTATLGCIMGYVDQKAGGSILPSAIIHGLSNVYACVIIL